MRKQKEGLSIKDRLRIQIKRTRPMKLKTVLLLSFILFALLILIGTMHDIPVEEAPAALTTSKVQIRVSFAGDIEISDSIRKLANKSSYSNLLQGVSTYLKKSDYVIANLSGPILKYDVSHYQSTRDKNETSIYIRPAALRGLSKAGVNLPSFANDDTFNYGTTGIRSTLEVLKNNSMDYLGIAENSSEQPYKILTYEFESEKGEKEERNIAVMSVNDVVQKRSSVSETKEGIFNTSLGNIFESVYVASTEADYVIVYVHFSETEGNSVSEEEKELAHTLIDAGADVVIGNSNMLKCIEKYGDGLIAYGLGHFVSDELYSCSRDSAMLDFVVRNSGEVIIYITPVRVEEGRPVVIKDGFYARRIQKILTSQLLEEDYRITEEGIVRISFGELSVLKGE